MKIRVEFKLEDVWIGVFWRRHNNLTDVWICLLPCFPLHITFTRENA